MMKRIVLTLLGAFCGYESALADSSLSALTSAGALTGAEYYYCVQSTNSRKCTTSQIPTYITSLGYLINTGTPASGQIGVFTGTTTLQGLATFTFSAGALSIGSSGSAGTVALYGATSGSSTIAAPATAAGTITLPSTTGTLAVLGANTFTATQTYGGSIITQVRSSNNATITVSATTDYMLCLDPTSNAIAVNLPGSPTTGLTYLVKDCTGQAAAHNITITPAAGNIDGAANKVMSTAYQSLAVTYTGSSWAIN